MKTKLKVTMTVLLEVEQRDVAAVRAASALALVQTAGMQGSPVHIDVAELKK
jgi:hypothetical protein